MSEAQTGALLSELRARPASPLRTGLAQEFVNVGSTLTPQFSTAQEAITARVGLPSRSTAAVHIEDTATAMGIDVTLKDARDSVGRVAEGLVVYAHAHASGATLIHRPGPDGTEDFLSFETKPASPSVAFDVALGANVSGLRLVDGKVLEMLDARGAPRLRVAPPYIVGADGVQTDATLAVEGCDVDTSPAAPWGRPVTAPGATTCTLRVSWNDATVAYPAVLDPRWTAQSL